MKIRQKKKKGWEIKGRSLLGLQKSETDYVLIHYSLTNLLNTLKCVLEY